VLALAKNGKIAKDLKKALFPAPDHKISPTMEAGDPNLSISEKWTPLNSYLSMGVS
jgi:hypothetical protein